MIFNARNKEDKKNPYFAPYIAEDLANQPDTLILTCEFDPLRDEGEAYGKRLKEAGNYVEIQSDQRCITWIFCVGDQAASCTGKFHLYQ